jgi:hypothetical protein
MGWLLIGGTEAGLVAQTGWADSKAQRKQDVFITKD